MRRYEGPREIRCFLFVLSHFKGYNDSMEHRPPCDRCLPPSQVIGAATIEHIGLSARYGGEIRRRAADLSRAKITP